MRKAAKESAESGLTDHPKVLRIAADESSKFGSVDYTGRFEKAVGRKQLPGHDLHLGFPQQFDDQFRSLGIDIHDPKHMFELPQNLHTRKPDGVHTGPKSEQWNQRWEAFLQTKPTKEQVFEFRDKLAREFGISGYRGGAQ
jgi:hypothetical protein